LLSVKAGRLAGDYPSLRRAAIEAESLGYDLLYTWDHSFPLYSAADGFHLECWTTLAAWPRPPRALSLDRWSRAARIATPTSSPTWLGLSIGSPAAGSSWGLEQAG
jgi:hypothetical protein